MGKIITTSRNVGDLMSRMKGKYVGVSIAGGLAKILTANDSSVDFLSRYGQGFDIRDSVSAYDLFSEGFDIYPIPAEDLPQGMSDLDKATRNQNEVGIDERSLGDYLIEADFSDLNKFVLKDSDGESLGAHYWAGFVVSTGLASIVGVEFNGVAFTSDDANYAATFGAGAGAFVLWIRLENYRESFVLGNGGAESGFVFNVKDTNVEDVIAPFMESAVAYFEDDHESYFEGNKVIAYAGSELTSVLVDMNSTVYLNGTPKAMYVVDGGEDVEYGTITVDEFGRVEITPSEGMGESTAVGTNYIRVPADSVRHRGVGNLEVIIEVEVVATPAIEVLHATMHFAEGESLLADEGVFTVTEGRVITAIDVQVNNFVTVAGSAVATLTVGDTPATFGDIEVHPMTRAGIRIVPTGDMGICDTVQLGVLSIPASVMTHRGESSAALSYSIDVIAAPVEE